MPGLLDNQSPHDPPSTYVSTGSNGYANCFKVDGFVTPSHVRYYATGSGSTGRPSALILFQYPEATVVRNWASIPNPSAAGWTEYYPGDMPELDPNKEYRLKWQNSLNTVMPMWGVDATVAPPAPFLWAGDPSLWGNGTAAPATAWTGQVGAELVAGTSVPNPDPPDTGAGNPTPSVAGDLNWWLNIATTNPDSAPKWLYDWWAVDRLVLTAARDAIDAWNTRAGVLFGTSGTLLGGLLASRLDSLLATMDLVDSHIAELGIPAQVSDTDALADLIADVATDVGASRNLTPWPGEGWAKVAETTFEGCLSWDQQADLFVVGFEVIPEHFGTTEACGVTLYHRLAWAAERNGDHVGERKYIEFANALVDNKGRRMNGLILVSHPLCEGTVEAWQINP